MKRILPIVVALGVLSLGAAVQAAPKVPFGSHASAYVAGTVRPSHVSQAQLDSAAKSFYDQWKAQYLVAGCGTGRYYVDVNGSGGGGMSAQSISVSEGHGYGMMIVPLMAGYDPNAQTIFDGLYAFFRDHPSLNHRDLMAWNQVRDCSSSGGTDSAADGDLDIAFGLLLADKQWGSAGTINYLAEAKKVIAAIKAKDIHPSAHTVLMGDWADPNSAALYSGTRPSDFMLDHFRAFGAVGGDAVWSAVTDRALLIVETLQTQYSPATGLLPDFVQKATTSPQPAPPNFLEGNMDDDYDYNSCRVPWRLGTDYLVSGDARTLAALRRINAWLTSKTGGDPAKIRSGYHLDGVSYVSYYDLAFIAPFAVGMMSESANQALLNKLWDETVNTPLSGDGYYGNTLKTLSLIVLSGNWWSPVTASGSTPALTCDLDGSGGLPTVADVQLCANQAVGAVVCGNGDVDGSGSCNVVDVQKVVNAALGSACP